MSELSKDELELRRQHREARTTPGPEVARMDLSAVREARIPQGLRPLDPAELDRVVAIADLEAHAEMKALRRRARWDAYDSTRPSMYRSAAYVDLGQPSGDRKDPIRKLLSWWRMSESKNLVIAGEPGRGKTHAAWAICNEVAVADRDAADARPVTVRAMTALRLREILVPAPVHAARDEVASANRARVLEEARTATLLLIDDLTAANVTDWFRGELHGLIDYRNTANDTRTIVTLNAPSKAEFTGVMIDRLGQAIVSRLNDDAVYVWLDGPDRRIASTWDPFA